MKLSFIFSAVVFLLSIALPAIAEEELAPGYNGCIGNAVSTFDQIECVTKANEYWDKILNANYKKLRASCKGDENEKECEQTLLKAQRLWIQYRETMMPLFARLHGGGTLSRLEADIFYAEETKKQAKILQGEEK